MNDSAESLAVALDHLIASTGAYHRDINVAVGVELARNALAEYRKRRPVPTNPATKDYGDL